LFVKIVFALKKRLGELTVENVCSLFFHSDLLGCEASIRREIIDGLLLTEFETFADFADCGMPHLLEAETLLFLQQLAEYRVSGVPPAYLVPIPPKASTHHI
jgi:hypothetical protein